MSEATSSATLGAMSALNGAVSAGKGAQVAELPVQGMVTLRGDQAKLSAVVTQVTGCAMPGQRGIAMTGERAVAWMSPDELLLMMPHEEVGGCLAALRDALEGVHSLAADVSDARAVFDVTGAGAREVLARLCPVNLSAEAFGPGEVRRTRMAQVPAAFWINGDGSLRVVCFRSVARYTFDILAGAATGEPVGFL